MLYQDRKPQQFSAQAKRNELPFPSFQEAGIEFLGLWEQLNNPDSKLVDFDQFRQEAGKKYCCSFPSEIDRKDIRHRTQRVQPH